MNPDRVLIVVALIGVKIVVYAAVSFLIRRFIPPTIVERLREKAQSIKRRLKLSTQTGESTTIANSSYQKLTDSTSHHIANEIMERLVKDSNHSQNQTALKYSTQIDINNNEEIQKVSTFSDINNNETVEPSLETKLKNMSLSNASAEAKSSVEPKSQQPGTSVSIESDLNNNDINLRHHKKWERVLAENELFEVVYDIFTPRPHFIILLRHKSTKRQVNDLNAVHLEILLNLVEVFRKKFNLMNETLTLSFHTGYWASKASEFHAHIVVELDVYLRIFNQYGIAEMDGFRGHAMRNKTWKIKPDRRPISLTYIENVRNYLVTNKAKSREFQCEEIESIHQKKHLWTSRARIQASHGFEIEFDESEPKIHFRIGQNSNEPPSRWRLELILEMCRISIMQGYFNRSNGCHICLTMPTSTNSNPSPNPGGYIRVAADTFYQLHPKPDTFLENFTKNNDFYIST